ncbi:LysR family transcriptional regulator [Leeia sp. TBRC 13508]|uniref:LysR family transcriptional regulator n=1 Tax=Leeia speluncae TaxID=2884804 RepID=A0ABS8DAV5_9NEIS|nr:LysR family transcriptional regulator [Leeia speluncae]MCB6185346.1 LysR family transcriptional regulator [Leeia speluncae]
MLRLSLEALQVLDAIDREGSFSAAAEALHRVPSAITYIVQKLEQDLGVQIFDRSGHRAKLTQAGIELLIEGRHLLKAATALESRIKRAASGWETELTIALDTVVPTPVIFPLLEQFYQQVNGTKIRLTHEVFGGSWDALVEGRAQLVIGAPGESPSENDLACHQIGQIDFIFCVAPTHALAKVPEPLLASDIMWHRSVAVADSSRQLAPRSSGILPGQETLLVPDMRTKLTAQLAGIACGYLPRTLAEPYLQSGRLIRKEINEKRANAHFNLAWKSKEEGKALQWWIEQLSTPYWCNKIMESCALLNQPY